MKYEKQATEFVNAIRTIAKKEDNLLNLNSYLTHHFGEWLEKYANNPDDISAELKAFADMDI